MAGAVIHWVGEHPSQVSEPRPGAPARWSVRSRLELRGNRGSGTIVIMRKIVAILLGCIVLSGCRADPPPTIWKTGLSSPDGKWMAMAHTVQNGGFGSASIDTVVELKSSNGIVNSGKPYEILAFDCYGPAARAYVLSDENRGGTINLKMHWTDPTHLSVTYDGRADVNLQVVRFAGINIMLEVIPSTSSAPPGSN
jgi:hypothetical protein